MGSFYIDKNSLDTIIFKILARAKNYDMRIYDHIYLVAYRVTSYDVISYRIMIF